MNNSNDQKSTFLWHSNVVNFLIEYRYHNYNFSLLIIKKLPKQICIVLLPNKFLYIEIFLQSMKLAHPLPRSQSILYRKPYELCCIWSLILNNRLVRREYLLQHRLVRVCVLYSVATFYVLCVEHKHANIVAVLKCKYQHSNAVKTQHYINVLIHIHTHPLMSEYVLYFYWYWI